MNSPSHVPAFEDIESLPEGAASPIFPPAILQGNKWDLSHLNSYAFKCEHNQRTITVVVIFTCHCFTHSISKDPRAIVPPDEIYRMGNEVRVLNLDRYTLSKDVLPSIMKNLWNRKIFIADSQVGNYLTYEFLGTDGAPRVYSVFFKAQAAKSRKGRVILTVQSAYILDGGLSPRQKKAQKVGLHILLKAALDNRRIRG